MDDHSPALVASDLAHSYGAVRALDGLSLTAERGEVTALLGPNGAGKTTAVSCATGLLRPDAAACACSAPTPGARAPSTAPGWA